MARRPAAKKKVSKKKAAAKKAPSKKHVSKKASPRKKKITKKVTKKTTKKAAKKPAAYGARADHNAPINAYFDNITDPDLRAAADAYRALVEKHAPKAEAAIKWGKPTWMLNGVLCAIAAFKKHVTLQFFEAGTTLNDPKNLLEGTGKGCRHVKATNAKDIDTKAVIDFIKQAVDFNTG